MTASHTLGVMDFQEPYFTYFFSQFSTRWLPIADFFCEDIFAFVGKSETLLILEILLLDRRVGCMSAILA